VPVRAENIEDHVMHEEAYSISGEAAAKINTAKAGGRPVIAVGTTSVRCMESSALAAAGGGTSAAGAVTAGDNITSIFIYPGYRFKVADALFTNFHTPGSTLLMLVSAFAEQGGEVNAAWEGVAPGGKGNAAQESVAPGSEGSAAREDGRALILESYAEAVRQGYRFFSYGDAMLIL
jgi:S-adenosylmethionine:tRNA ribosyltransferase-isomerase